MLNHNSSQEEPCWSIVLLACYCIQYLSHTDLAFSIRYTVLIKYSFCSSMFTITVLIKYSFLTFSTRYTMFIEHSLTYQIQFWPSLFGIQYLLNTIFGLLCSLLQYLLNTVFWPSLLGIQCLSNTVWPIKYSFDLSYIVLAFHSVYSTYQIQFWSSIRYKVPV